MIAGLGSSGIATAIRTAGKARETMDTMARQIATGQRVSSVKDDGAAWARASALKSQQATNAGRKDAITALRVVAETQSVADEQSRTLFDQMVDVLVAAAGHAPGSQARQTLATEWTRLQEAFAANRVSTGLIQSGVAVQADGLVGIRGPQGDSLLGNQTMWTSLGASLTDFGWHTLDPLSNGVPQNAINIASGTAANLTNGLDTIRHMRDRFLALHTVRGGQAWLDNVADHVERDDARLQAALGALTDADLGAANMQRAQAETRQQLAIIAVREAISAYGTYAGGLLGNAQRTQRGIMV